MVFFTCNHCGESVKKPSVVKHYQTKCRNNSKFVSCMDCLKDFREEEYNSHTSCITEAEKYSGKDYVPKPSANAGLKKQESWVEIVRSILQSTDVDAKPEVRRVFQKLQMYDNVPRKKEKFIKFLWNSLKVHPGQAQPVWQVVEVALEKFKIARQQSATSKTKSKEQPDKETQNGTAEDTGNAETVRETNGAAENGVNGIVKKSKKKKKRSGEPNAEEVSPLKQHNEEPSAEEIPSEKQRNEDQNTDETLSKKKRRDEDRSAEDAPPKKKKKKSKHTDEVANEDRDEDRSAEDAPPKKKNKKSKHTDEITNGDAGNENDIVPEVTIPEKNQLATDAHVKNNEVIKFDWTNEIYSIVEKNDKEISLDNLKKIIFEKYRSICKVDKIEWKVEKTFNKKLRKSGLLVEDNVVKMTN